MTREVISLRGISRSYRSRGTIVHAVDSVSLDLAFGETFALVGESGCGKSTLARIVAGLLEPTEGSIQVLGRDVSMLGRRERDGILRQVQLIHQDPYASLNPIKTVEETLRAPLTQHRMVRSREQLHNRLYQILEQVGLTPANDFLKKYPFQLSGGQRQRASIARALTVEPRFIVADEAVSMVDASMRVSLLSLLIGLQRTLGVGILFITHDLAVAGHVAWSGRLGTMYLGRLVEIGATRDVISHPQHPYTRALFQAIPEPDPQRTRAKQSTGLRGSGPPSLLDMPRGCAFHPRCPQYIEGTCEASIPGLEQVGESTHEVACFAAMRAEVTQDAVHLMGHHTEVGS